MAVCTAFLPSFCEMLATAMGVLAAFVRQHEY